MVESLSYPFDSANILRKKKSLKRELLGSASVSKVKIAVLGGSTTSELVKILDLFLLKNDLEADFYESEYNKFYEDAVFENKQLEDFGPDIIYVHTTWLNLTGFPTYQMTTEEVDGAVKAELSKYQSIWSALSKYNCAIIQNNFDYPINRSLGNLDAYDIHGKTHFISVLNLKFAEAARDIKNLFINDINYLSSYIGLSTWFDRKLWHTAKYAVSFDAIPWLSQNLSNIICAIFGKTKKCLVLDLDHTCWGGVIGDDGLNGIHLGNETPTGESFVYFQNYVKELKDRGIILAVSSKNDTEIAKEGFIHSDTVLKLDDFTSFKANWEPKSQNIAEIAKEINIGLDSLVFIDDNSVERDIVSSQLPLVTVPNVGNDVISFVDHIEKNGFFEPIALSSDDISRNTFYKKNVERQEEQASFLDYNDYLQSLKMAAEIRPFSDLYLDRITQLINKTNQFNLTTKRVTIGDIQTRINNDAYISYYGKLEDKFGDNGLISVISGEIVEDTCHIELWLMSCRVLKRTMEYAMFDTFISACKKKGLTYVVGYYHKTAKNDMVANLLQQFGFQITRQEQNSTQWLLDINDYQNTNNIIHIKND